jgi:hypothetical protein
MTNKEIAIKVFKSHLALAQDSPTKFKNTVINEIIKTLDCGLRVATAFYNEAVKQTPKSIKLVRIPVKKFIIKDKHSKVETVEVESSEPEDADCYTVFEIVGQVVGRTKSFSTKGEATKDFSFRVTYWPDSIWLMIKGLGRNSGEEYRVERKMKWELKHIPKHLQKEVDMASS